MPRGKSYIMSSFISNPTHEDLADQLFTDNPHVAIGAARNHNVRQDIRGFEHLLTDHAVDQSLVIEQLQKDTALAFYRGKQYALCVLKRRLLFKDPDAEIPQDIPTREPGVRMTGLSVGPNWANPKFFYRECRISGEEVLALGQRFTYEDVLDGYCLTRHGDWALYTPHRRMSNSSRLPRFLRRRNRLRSGRIHGKCGWWLMSDIYRESLMTHELFDGIVARMMLRTDVTEENIRQMLRNDIYSEMRDQGVAIRWLPHFLETESENLIEEVCWSMKDNIPEQLIEDTVAGYIQPVEYVYKTPLWIKCLRFLLASVLIYFIYLTFSFLYEQYQIYSAPPCSIEQGRDCFQDEQLQTLSGLVGSNLESLATMGSYGFGVALLSTFIFPLRPLVRFLFIFKDFILGVCLTIL